MVTAARLRSHPGEVLCSAAVGRVTTGWLVASSPQQLRVCEQLGMTQRGEHPQPPREARAQGQHRTRPAWHSARAAQGPALTDAEEEQSLHAEELLRRDLQPAELLGEVPHPHALAVHAGLVHAVPVGRDASGTARGDSVV